MLRPDPASNYNNTHPATPDLTEVNVRFHYDFGPYHIVASVAGADGRHPELPAWPRPDAGGKGSPDAGGKGGHGGRGKGDRSGRGKGGRGKGGRGKGGKGGKGGARGRGAGGRGA